MTPIQSLSRAGRPWRPSLARLATGTMSASIALIAASAVHAEDAKDVTSDPSILRICASANEHPYSTRDEQGFENKIAKVVAEAMGRTPVFVWHNKPAIYLVRDKLNMRVCDVVMGLDTGDERVATSKPYYRAPYVFVQPKDTKLDITRWDSPDLVKADKIGFVPGSPAQVMLTKLDLFNVHFNYMNSLTNFKSRRNEYTRINPKRLVGEVADGTADMAVAFAPEVARYVKANDKLKMLVIPDNNERVDGEKVPHHFDQSIGVRKDDRDLLEAINFALEKADAKIKDVLRNEGIPIIVEPSASKS